MKLRARTIRFATLLAASLLAAPVGVIAKASPERTVSPRYDPAHRVFRLDAGDVTYAMGVNTDGILQTIYWGERLPADDPLGPAVPAPERSSFDPAGALTPQEYAGWGGAMTATPASRPRLLVVAGPNGAGKTSMTTPSTIGTHSSCCVPQTVVW